jgi:hypothetical protein
MIDTRAPLTGSPLNTGLMQWYMVTYQMFGGRTWYDLARGANGTIINMDSGASGWRSTTRPGGMGHLQFDGTNDLVRLPITQRHKPSQITVAAWVLSQTTGVRAVYSVDYAATGTWGTPNAAVRLIQNGSGFPEFRVAVSGIERTATGAVSTQGAWSHWVGTYDGSAVRLFVDGRQVAATGITGVIDWGTSADASIGDRSPYTTGHRFVGGIDDVRVWSRALSAGDVAALFADSMTGYASTLRRIPLAFSAATATQTRPWLFRRRASVSGSGVI